MFFEGHKHYISTSSLGEPSLNPPEEELYYCGNCRTMSCYSSQNKLKCFICNRKYQKTQDIEYGWDEV